MIQVSMRSWFNGEIGERECGAPSVASASFHLGTSVFDGIMAYWNGDHYYIHRADEHLARFRRGAACMGMAFSWTVEEMLTGINDLLKLEPNGTQYIRPIAYRRRPELWLTGSEGHPVDVSIFTVRAEDHRDVNDLLCCQISTIERISTRSIPAQVKVSGSYVNSFHARKTAEIAGFHDAIMFDREGRLAEASAANVFIIMGERLITPPQNPDIFPGITRQVLIELAISYGIEFQERDIRYPDLADIDGAFLCSTLMELRGLSLLGERSLPTNELPVFVTLIDAFRSLTHQ